MKTIFDIANLDALDKFRLAVNCRIDPEILHELAKDNDPSIRAAVAQNPNISYRTQFMLAKSNDSRILEALASNAHTSIDILADLAKHSDGYVRMRVAENKQTSQETLNELTNDPNSSVKEKAMKNLNYFIYILEKNLRDEEARMEYERKQKREELRCKEEDALCR